MDVRRTRQHQLLAAGTYAALTIAALTACASGTVSSPSSPATTSAAASSATATPAANGGSPEPTSSTASASAVPSDQPSNGPNTIRSPAPGATVSGPGVTVTGTGTAFEATLLWEVLPVGGGQPITKGFTTAGANGQVGPFSFTTSLPTGQVTVVVWEPDMSDGAAGGSARRNLVAVTFTVQ